MQKIVTTAAVLTRIGSGAALAQGAPPSLVPWQSGWSGAVAAPQAQAPATVMARPGERAALATLAEPEKPRRRNAASPIALFLGAKLVAYTVLGVFLGWLGSVLQLGPYSRAALQIGIGIFMLGTAARLFNLHPIFRYFVI